MDPITQIKEVQDRLAANQEQIQSLQKIRKHLLKQKNRIGK